jgi:predicted lipid carrier protein YhbT
MYGESLAQCGRSDEERIELGFLRKKWVTLVMTEMKIQWCVQNVQNTGFVFSDWPVVSFHFFPEYNFRT